MNYDTLRFQSFLYLAAIILKLCSSIKIIKTWTISKLQIDL